MHSDKVDFSTERRIADHLASVRWEHLPPAARSAAIRAILWWLATGLEGSTEPGQVPVGRHVAAQGGKAEATAIGTGQRTTAELAGLLNGRAGKAWEQEDKYWVDETIGFAVGCCVVPAALAAAEAKGAVGGTEIATAVALGIDLEARLLRPLGLGFVFGRATSNATFALGTYGAAAAAAKILGLDSDGFLDALGLAHCTASGNYQGQAEGRGVSLQAGSAVRNGIAAAKLAQLGMPGPRASIMGSVGLYAVHYPNSAIAVDDILRGLGEEFLNVNLGFKGYPSGVVAHPAIDAVLAVRAELRGRPIRSMEFTGPPSLKIMAQPIERKRAPKSAIEAQFSIPWAAACAVRDGGFTIDHYGDAAIEDAELQRLAGLVSVAMVADMKGTHLKVTLADGSVIEPPTVMASKGHPNNPLSTEEIEGVLKRAARRVGLRDDNVATALSLLRDFERLGDVGQVMRLLSVES